MARYSQDWRRVEELKEDVILVSTGGRGATLYSIQGVEELHYTLYSISKNGSTTRIKRGRNLKG